MTESDGVHFVVPPEASGERLDRFVAERTDLSRTQVARLVEEGAVLWNGERPRKSEPLAEGDRITVQVPEPKPVEALPEPIPLEILHEDEHLLVVNKAAGMVVHPAPGNYTGTLVNALLHHVTDLSGIGGALRPGIVHRLDRDTSGLLVVAKSDAAHRTLSAALKRREIRRLYQATAWGHLDEPHLKVDAPIGRDANDRKRMAVRRDGRRAVTHIRIRERWPAAELLDVGLETGRTHQIRVHLAHLGHPVVGDSLYGAGWERGMDGPVRGWARELARRVPRQFLHASRLAFQHPATGKTMRFEAPLPDDLATAAAWARGADRTGEEG